MARNRPTGDLTGSQKTGGAGKKPSTKGPPRYVTPSAQGSQGLPSGPYIPPVQPKKPKDPKDQPMTGHSSFFHSANYMG
jgi:hypothetical protein